MKNEQLVRDKITLREDKDLHARINALYNSEKFTNFEIADKVGLSYSSVRRILEWSNPSYPRPGAPKKVWSRPRWGSRMRELDSKKDLIKSMWKDGLSLSDIHRKTGVLLRYVTNLVKSSFPPVKRKCAIYECSKIIEDYGLKKQCCCPAHSVLHTKRREYGIVIKSAECLNPACSNVITNIRRRKYCSDRCGSVDSMRWARDPDDEFRHRFYSRILGVPPSVCAVCGEHRVVDEHRIKFLKGKSDKSSDVMHLCANHHAMIHRGYARVTGGKYQMLDQTIKCALVKKQAKKVEEFLESKGRHDLVVTLNLCPSDEIHGPSQPVQ